MDITDLFVIIRGGGDLATGAIYRLHQAGCHPLVLELPEPLVVRRRVAVATAVREGAVSVEMMPARRAGSVAEAMGFRHAGIVPVLVSPSLPELPHPIDVLIDARMAKRNIDTTRDQASLVIALGPGFVAGADCHAVIETMRGHALGRVIWSGSALPNTGTPGLIAGKGAERVLRAPAAGIAQWAVDIGDKVESGQLLGEVAGQPIRAPFAGVMRGLVAPGTLVTTGLKIGDVDARADPLACFTISDKALAIGGGVLEAMLAWGARAAGHTGRTGDVPLPATVRGLREAPQLDFVSAFDLRERNLIALTGAGGKTSLLFALSGALGPGVVFGATTRLALAELAMAPAVCRLDDLDDVPAALRRFGRCLVAGADDGDKILGMPVRVAADLWRRHDVHTVIVEADGSRGMPLKAPAEHEPVIPAEATLVIPIVGMSALGQPLNQVAHRPGHVAAITGLEPGQPVTAEALATLLGHAEGGLKGVPAGATVIPFLNQAESTDRLVAAREVARQLLESPRIAHVVIGALRSPSPILEVHRRVRGVVLAAGSAERMGRTKQLLPWGDTTMLGQALRHLGESRLTDGVVVTGHDATAVAAEANRHGVPVIHNPAYAEGEMLSSLQTAVRALDQGVGAVLVMLADQPMVDAGIIDQLLAAYWRGCGRIVAPAFRGRRGNPVLIDRAFFGDLLSLPQGAAPRDLLRRHHDAVHLVEVGSETVLRDLDSPEDLARWAPDVPGTTNST